MSPILDSNRWRALGAIFLGFLLFGWVTAGSASAHTDGKLQLSAEPAGPFKMTVWTFPDPAEAGEFHVTVSVFSADDAAPILDAEVMVEMIALDGGQTILAPATVDEATNKFLYEAILFPEEPGQYQVTISAVDTSGARGEAAFDLEFVANRNSLNPLYLLPLALGIGAIILVWMARRQSG